ncbi:MAG: sulfite exporter TauE/SafE family protein [Planctomycetes bacterium]|nr:sulfite exporter TauE/SafE family protein [Planctomycetota bacterium]
MSAPHPPDAPEERDAPSSATIQPRRVLVMGVLPAVCALLVVLTAAFAPAEERAPILWSSLVAAASGLAATSIGVYGGVLVPGLLLLGVDARFAAAASLFLQVLVIPLGAGAHVKLGNVTRHVAVPLVAGGVVGAFAGPFFSAAMPKEAIARIVSGSIVLVGLLVLATLRFGGLATTARVEDVARTKIGSVGLVAGFASGVSGAGWGPIGVKLLLLLGIEPRQAIGSSLLGRVFMSLSAVIGYLVSENAFRDIQPNYWLLLPLFAGSIATMIAGVSLVHRMQRERAVLLITLLSIALALPTLIRGH